MVSANDSETKPLPKTYYGILGPLPLANITDAMAQVEEQGWSVRHIVYAGTVRQPASSIIKAGMPQVMEIPLYGMIISKVCDSKPEGVTLRFQKAPDPT